MAVVAGTVQSIRVVNISGDAIKPGSVKLTMASVTYGSGSTKTGSTFAIPGIKPGDRVHVQPINIAAGDLVGVGASVTADDVLTIINDSATQAGTETFYVFIYGDQ